MPSAERIRDALLESRPDQPLPPRLAGELAAIATLNGLSTLDVLLWLEDTPGPLTSANFCSWIAIRGLLPETTAGRIAAYARQAYRCGLFRAPQIAQRAGMTAYQVRQVLTSEGPVSLAVAAALSAALHIQPRDLYTLAEWRDIAE